jgi:hypothetical protein
LLQHVRLPDTADALFELVHTYREGPEAVLALGLLGDARAGPLLLERFESLEPAQRRAHYEALQACGAIAPEKAAGYVIEFLRNDPRQERLPPGVFIRPGSTRLALGYWILEDPGDLAEPIANSLIAGEYRSVAYSLRGEKMSRDFVARLRDGSLTCDELLAALGNRAEFRARVDPELRLITDGEAAGFAAAMLEDTTLASLRLRGSDDAAACALLAAARMSRIPLPIEAVRSTFSRPGLRRAALLYLEAIDSAESRQTLREQFADRPLLLRAAREYPARPLESFDDRFTIPTNLLKEFGAGALEVLRLEYSWFRFLDILTVRRFADRVECALQDAPGREWFRDLEASEWESIRKFIEQHSIEDLPAHAGSDQEVSIRYFRAKPGGAHSFSMNEPSPDLAESKVYRDLCTSLSLPLFREGFRLRYEQPSLEVLYARRDRQVGAFRLEEGRVALCLVPWRGHYSPEDASWHHLDAGKLGPQFPDPTPKGPDLTRFESDAGVLTWESEIKVTAPDGTERILLNSTNNGRVSADRRWLLVSSSVADGESVAFQLHLIDLRDFRMLPAGRRAHPLQNVVAWIPAHEAFLCHHAAWEHFLLDPALLTTHTVEGEFRPCTYLHRLQPGTAEGTFWTPLHDAESNRWKVGLYDTAKFRFYPVQTVPLDPNGLQQIHVDVRRNQLYVLYAGHLLRMPLRDR